MLRVLRVVGFVMVLVGSVWALQGIGVLQGSPMTGEGFWLGAGLAFLIVGAALVFLGYRPAGPPTMT